jgi:hypothetical protein
MDIELCTYLWDQVFFFGELFLLKGAIAICKVIYNKNKDDIDNAENTYIDGLKLIKQARLIVSKTDLQ